MYGEQFLDTEHWITSGACHEHHGCLTGGDCARGHWLAPWVTSSFSSSAISPAPQQQRLCIPCLALSPVTTTQKVLD